jgi:hypothetical protein
MGVYDTIIGRFVVWSYRVRKRDTTKMNAKLVEDLAQHTTFVFATLYFDHKALPQLLACRNDFGTDEIPWCFTRTRETMPLRI